MRYTCPEARICGIHSLPFHLFQCAWHRHPPLHLPWMAFASRLPTQASALHKQFDGRARSVAPYLLQQRSSTSLHTHVNRRHSLLSGSAIIGSALLQSQSTVAQAATAVYHQVNVSLPSIDETDWPERPEDPPTYVRATGRIVASRCSSTHQRGQGVLQRLLCGRGLLQHVRPHGLRQGQLSRTRIM